MSIATFALISQLILVAEGQLDYPANYHTRASIISGSSNQSRDDKTDRMFQQQQSSQDRQPSQLFILPQDNNQHRPQQDLDRSQLPPRQEAPSVRLVKSYNGRQSVEAEEEDGFIMKTPQVVGQVNGQQALAGAPQVAAVAALGQDEISERSMGSNSTTTSTHSSQQSETTTPTPTPTTMPTPTLMTDASALGTDERVAPTQQANVNLASSEEADDDTRIPINVNRQQFITHDQLLNASAKDDHLAGGGEKFDISSQTPSLKEQAAPQSSGSRMAMPRLALVSSFLSGKSQKCSQPLKVSWLQL